MKKLLLVLLSLIMSFSLLATGCTKDDAKDDTKTEDNASDDTQEGTSEEGTIKIGLITPITGQVAQYGIAVENAVNLAVNEANANGGINGRQIELITYDDKADATESMTVFDRLVQKDGVVAVIGPVISSTSLAVAPLAEDAQIPMITPTATNINVTPDYDYVFRACYIDPFQGSNVANFAVDNLSAKKAAILYNSGDDYSVGLAEAFKTQFEAKGGTIVNYEGYTSDDKDFKAVLTNVKDNAPDVIFIPDYYNTVGLIAGQIKELAIDAKLLGGDGWDGVQNEYADVTEGSFFANHYAIDDPSEIVQGFISSYSTEFGETPNALGALGYDAAKIMFQAIANAGSTDSGAILDALKATQYEGVTGNITFDEYGDPVKDISIITVSGGQLKLETKVGSK